MDKSPLVNKRAEPRIKADVEVKTTLLKSSGKNETLEKSGKPWAAKLENISRTGMAVTTKQVCKRHDLLSVHFKLSKQSEGLETVAEVAWCQQVGALYH